MKESFFKTSLGVGVLLLLSACGNVGANNARLNSQTQTYNWADQSGGMPTSSSYALTSFRWQMTGSADLHFVVSPEGSNFRVRIIQYNYMPHSGSVVLVQGQAPNAYLMLQRVFSGSDSFISYPYPGFSGIFNSVIRVDRNGMTLPTIQNPALSSGNSSGIIELHNFVAAQL